MAAGTTEKGFRDESLRCVAGIKQYNVDFEQTTYNAGQEWNMGLMHYL